jgi:hypothetical protein
MQRLNRLRMRTSELLKTRKNSSRLTRTLSSPSARPLAMADPLAAAFGDLPDSGSESDSEPENQSDAESSEEEVDSDEEQAKKGVRASPRRRRRCG